MGEITMADKRERVALCLPLPIKFDGLPYIVAYNTINKKLCP